MRAHGLPDRVCMCRGGKEVALGEGLVVRALASEHGRVALGRVPYPGEVAEDVHPPLRTRAYRHGAVLIYVVEMGGVVLAHVGSAYLPPNRGRKAGTGPAFGRHMSAGRPQRAPLPCDLLFVCASGWKRAPDFVPRLLDAFRPKVVVPFHWDNFAAPLHEGRDPPRAPFVDVEGLAARLSRCAPETQVRRVKVGQAIQVAASWPNDRGAKGRVARL